MKVEIIGLLTDEDRAKFKAAVAKPLCALESELEKTDKDTLGGIFSEAKFIDHEALTHLGLHVLRCLLAERVISIRRGRRTSVGTDVRRFWRDGVTVVQDFMPKKEFENFSRSQRMPDSTKERFRQLVNDCMGLDGFRDNLDVQRLVHEGRKDSQCDMHLDTFCPSLKGWFYLYDVDLNDGPLHVVPGSHQCTIGKLRWLYETSVISSQPDHPLYTSRNAGVPAGGSFRVNRLGDCESGLQEMGFGAEMAMVYPRNTLILADTSGFHRRGTASVGTVRQTARAAYRPRPFQVD